MSYWNNHPEDLEQVTINALPEPWISQVRAKEISLSDVPKDISHKAMIEGTEKYFADMTAWSFAICEYGGC